MMNLDLIYEIKKLKLLYLKNTTEDLYEQLSKQDFNETTSTYFELYKEENYDIVNFNKEYIINFLSNRIYKTLNIGDIAISLNSQIMGFQNYITSSKPVADNIKIFILGANRSITKRYLYKMTKKELSDVLYQQIVPENIYTKLLLFGRCLKPEHRNLNRIETKNFIMYDTNSGIRVTFSKEFHDDLKRLIILESNTVGNVLKKEDMNVPQPN